MNDKFDRRTLFSRVLTSAKAPFQDDIISIEFQGVTLNFPVKNTPEEVLFFVENDILEEHNINKLSPVSFSKFPSKKTDTFFQNLLKSQNLTPQKCYALTTVLPLKSPNFWDKIIWITKEIPGEIPPLKCPLLIIQDIAHFNPERSPAELLPYLPPKSDIFIAQQLDFSKETGPTMKRIYDFLAE